MLFLATIGCLFLIVLLVVSVVGFAYALRHLETHGINSLDTLLIQLLKVTCVVCANAIRRIERKNVVADAWENC